MIEDLNNTNSYGYTEQNTAPTLVLDNMLWIYQIGIPTTWSYNGIPGWPTEGGKAHGIPGGPAADDKEGSLAG